MSNTASSVLNIARGEIGYYRHDDPKQGTKYGRWYAEDHGSYYGTNGVPFCAMFASWVFDRAGAKCAGLPEAYVPYIKSKAKKKGAVLSNKRNAKPGDLVIFDWNDDGSLNHVGIVEKNKGSYLQTIEGNSPAGYVSRRTRSWGTVDCIVRPSYGGSSSSSGSKEVWQVDVDGYFGPDTCGLAQAVEGITVNRHVYGQPVENRKCFALSKGQAACFVFSGGGRDGGSLLVRRVQNDCGIPWKECDGWWGPDTTKRFIKKWVKNPDHLTSLLAPSVAVKAYQRHINALAKEMKVYK